MAIFFFFALHLTLRKFWTSADKMTFFFARDLILLGKLDIYGFFLIFLVIMSFFSPNCHNFHFFVNSWLDSLILQVASECCLL